MAHGVFMHRIDSKYEDIPSEKYQFPKSYLTRAKQCEKDWVVYYEPTTVPNSKGYFAVARVDEIKPDPNDQNTDNPEMYLAIIEPGTYLDFGNHVPFRDGETYFETNLLNEQGRMSGGNTQSAVRIISPKDFNRILECGLVNSEDILPRDDADANTPIELPSRSRIDQLASRIVRDRNFRKTVLRAYSNRCAITGHRFLNGNDRAEAVAAHIRPVKDDGPDIVGNGVALSGTAHWMFDRGLISLSDDLEILISRQSNDQEAIQEFVHDSRTLQGLSRDSDRPRPEFLAWHREHYFKD